MASRSELIDRAKEIIREHPASGRRKIATELRSEYGKALRDAVILSLQREIYPQRDMAYRATREKRLKEEGFLPFERKQFKSLAFTKTDFMREERRQRARDYREFQKGMKEQGFTKRQSDRIWKSNITDQYAAEGFELADGKPDFWQSFRKIRVKAIKDGTWKETPRYRGRSHSKLDAGGHFRKIDKGKLKQQRERHRDRQREKALELRRQDNGN